MKIGVIIGNGFDIEMGLKTSFHDFYEHEKNNGNKILEMIHKDLQESQNSDEQLWSDFEYYFGEKFELLEEKCEKDNTLLLNEFIDFRQLFKAYLIEQQKQLSNEQKNLLYNIGSRRTFHNSIDHVLHSMTTEQKHTFKRMATSKGYDDIVSFGNNVSIDYEDYQLDIFTFNYTTYLRNDTSISNNIHYLHHNIREGMFIGVDNIDQIKSSRELNTEEQLIFIKSQSIQNHGSLTFQSNKELLEQKDVIILHGLSLGETDAHWWSFLSRLSFKNKLIIICIYLPEEEYQKYLGDEFFTNQKKEQSIIEKFTKHALDVWEEYSSDSNEEFLLNQKNIMVHFHDGSTFSLNPERD